MFNSIGTPYYNEILIMFLVVFLAELVTYMLKLIQAKALLQGEVRSYILWFVFVYGLWQTTQMQTQTTFRIIGGNQVLVSTILATSAILTTVVSFVWTLKTHQQ